MLGVAQIVCGCSMKRGSWRRNGDWNATGTIHQADPDQGAHRRSPAERPRIVAGPRAQDQPLVGDEPTGAAMIQGSRAALTPPPAHARAMPVTAGHRQRRVGVAQAPMRGHDQPGQERRGPAARPLPGWRS